MKTNLINRVQKLDDLTAVRLLLHLGPMLYKDVHLRSILDKFPASAGPLGVLAGITTVQKRELLPSKQSIAITRALLNALALRPRFAELLVKALASLRRDEMVIEASIPRGLATSVVGLLSAVQAAENIEASSNTGGAAAVSAPLPIDELCAMAMGSAAPLHTVQLNAMVASGGGSTPSSALPQDKRTAWPHLVCDESVVIGLPFDVQIGLRGKPDPKVGGMGKMSLPAQGCTLDIQIVFDPESLAIVEGEQSFRLEVSSGDHYPLRTLKMVALAGADLQQQREIVVTYGLNGVLVGCACRSVCAVENLNARPPSGTTPSSSRMELTRDKSEAKADLTIIIKHGDDTGNRRLIFSATSPHVSLPVSDKPTSVDIGDEPSKFLADTAKLASGGLKPWQLFLTLKGRGKQIAAKMPMPIKEALREVAARIAPRIASVLIVSDDPYMPWELAVFDPPLGSHETDSSPFLGAQVACGRWILSNDERPSPDPNRYLAVRQQVVVSGVYDQIPGWPRLKDAEQEAEELLKLWDGTSEPVEATFADVVNCLEGKPAADVLHFALHGKVDPHGFQDGLVLIEQSVDKSSPASPNFLSPDVVEGCAFEKYGRAPFVFLNACQVGVGREVLGDYSGLTAAFLKAGASAVVAPLWSINDADARGLALELYKRASVGEAPSEILRSQRSLFTEQAAKGNVPNHGSPTHLAYQFFGHPNYILKPEQPNGRQS